MPDGIPQVTVSVPKSPAQSKIVVLNLLGLILAAADQTLQLLQPALRTEVYGLAFFALAVVNILLRFWTTQPVEFVRLFGLGMRSPSAAELDAARSAPSHNDQTGGVLTELLGWVVGLALLCGLIFGLGMRHGEQRVAGEQATALRAATDQLRNRADEASEAATEARRQVSDLQANEAGLQAQLKQLKESENGRLVVLPRVAARVCPVLVAAVQPAPATGLQRPAADDAMAARQDGNGAAAPVLTADAVRLWNAALGGADDASAGDTGRADGAAAKAGAAGDAKAGDATAGQPSGITLTDAWSNHITNATRCAQDRVRFGRLQTLLTGWQATPAPR